MPWKVSDVERFKKGLTDKQKRQWVSVANSALSRCLADGGSQDACEASAIRQASGTVETNNMQTYSFSTNTYEIRRETYEGRQHIVVPVIMLKDGVHSGSRGPLLHTQDEYGRCPASWDGIPVTLSHPKDANGNLVPANSPQVLEKTSIGRIFNTKINGGLKAEAWIDEQKCQSLSPDALAYIIERRPLDVSVGVFSDEDETPGNWNGETYSAIARNHRPDHLALLLGETGACSWNDGCGIRANQATGGDKLDTTKLQANALSYTGTESIEWSAPNLSDFGVKGNWSELTQSDKSKVASHYLIGSSSAETFSDLKLPVVNPSTGKLNERALRAVISGRGASVEGVSAEQKSAARRRAYRLLNSEFEADLTIPENLSVYAAGYKEICDQVRMMVDAMDTDSRRHFLEDVFNDGTFVYEVRGDIQGYYKRGYKINDDGNIEFIGEPQKVILTKIYTPVQGNSQQKGGINTMEKKPCCPEKINLIIQSKHTRFEESDRAYLEGLEEGLLVKLLPIEPEPPTAPQVNKEQIVEVVKEQFKTTEQFLSLAPAEIKDTLTQGLSLYAEQKKSLVDKIVANAGTSGFTAEELGAKSIVELSKLASLIKVPSDFSGLGSGSVRKDNEVVPQVFPVGVK